MGSVIELRRPRRETVRRVARKYLTEAMRQVGDPKAVVIVVLGRDGRFSVRSVRDESAIDLFDTYSRAGSICDRERMALLEGD